MKNTKPIASQTEADQVKQYLVDTTAKTLKIPADEATRRVDGLLKSGILQMGGGPADPQSRMMIEAFLSIPSTQYAHLK